MGSDSAGEEFVDSDSDFVVSAFRQTATPPRSSRRQFLGWASRAAVVLTGVAGGIVGFKPSPPGEHFFGPAPAEAQQFCFHCTMNCQGPCGNAQSCCSPGGGWLVCCVCNQPKGCSSGRVSITCNPPLSCSASCVSC